MVLTLLSPMITMAAGAIMLDRELQKGGLIKGTTLGAVVTTQGL